jgi:hypothetical protein
VKIDASECLRILGVAADATPEMIRQAYLDLVRVWHPDRFQSDDRLRQIADQNLRDINRAFDGLKGYRPAAAPPSQDPFSPPPPAGSPPAAPTPPLRQPARPNRRPIRLSAVAAAAAICLLGLTAAWRIVRYLHEADPDAPPPAESTVARPPGEPAPRRIRAAANRSGDAPAPEAAAATSVQPLASGTELFRAAGFRGFGELLLTNHTDLEALARLVGRNGAVFQTIYIAPGASAAFHSVARGVYSLHADFGTGLDARTLRFLDHRFTPGPVGPMEFLEYTNEQGITGTHFEVALRR